MAYYCTGMLLKHYWSITSWVLLWYYLGTTGALLEYMGIAGIILQQARGLYSTGVPDRSDSGECLVVSVTG